ncbi:MAG: LacI family DNA-binding transcriptional regulator [Bacteroidota bacterium]
MSTTIKEVARHAGVSIATVSRVFNNTGPVEINTRARVRASALELRYVPNALGRNLSRRRTDAIGLLLPDLFGEFFSEVIRGADETAQSQGYHLLVSSSHSNRQEIEAALKMMRGRVDALVIMSPHIDAQTLNANLPRNHPVELLNCQVEDTSFDSLNIDNYGGAYSMVGHLIEHGHRSIAIVTGTPGNIDAEERLRGYRDAMAQGGCPLDDALVIRGDFSESCGVRAVEQILALNPVPTAVFASNDSMAIGVLGAFHHRGVQIPEQMALAGFDDVPVASFLSPPLTSVQVGIHNLGVLAISRAIDAIKLGESFQTRQAILPTTLRLRESCGCPSVI